MVRNKDRVTKEGMMGAWLGFVITTIVMITLTFALFGSWQFWMWFAEMGTLIGGITTSIYYFGRDSKKCYNCGNTMDWNIEYCKKCGTKIPSNCENCGSDINTNAQYCEKCGKSTVLGGSSKSNISNEPKKIQTSYKTNNKSNKFCPACGSKFELNANHCPSCGIKL